MMKIIKSVTILSFLISQAINAQNEIGLITNTLNDYIEGTANGQPERVQRAFHPELNLYSIANDSLSTWNGLNYISRITKGEKSNRIGRIVSIDYVHNAAMAKIEIVMPSAKRIFTDYLMLLKYGGDWKIIHKSYTATNYPK